LLQKLWYNNKKLIHYNLHNSFVFGSGNSYIDCKICVLERKRKRGTELLDIFTIFIISFSMPEHAIKTNSNEDCAFGF